MQHTPISEIKPGNAYQTTLVVKQADVKVTGTGKTFINAITEDASGRIGCIQWGPTEPDIDAWTQHDVIEVDAKCGTYKDKSQLTITAVRTPAPDEVKWGVLLPSSPLPYLWMKEQLEHLINRIAESDRNPTNPVLARVMTALLITPDFLYCPAATFMHHAYIHGLLEHSLSVTWNALRYMSLGSDTPTWDVDVVITGSLLHDLGKIREYTKTGKRLPASKELGHALIGCEMLSQAAMTENVDLSLVDKIKHVIASHHGRTEWGAIVEPQTPEAWLVHCMDLADSRMFAGRRKE